MRPYTKNVLRSTGKEIDGGGYRPDSSRISTSLIILGGIIVVPESKDV